MLESRDHNASHTQMLIISITTLCIIAVILFVWILKRRLLSCGDERNSDNGGNSMEMLNVRDTDHERADNIPQR